MVEWIERVLDAMHPREVREKAGATQAEWGMLLGASPTAIARWELDEHAKNPVEIARGNPLPSWGARVGVRRALIAWVVLACDDDPKGTATTRDFERRTAVDTALRRLWSLRVIAKSIDPAGGPEALAAALRHQTRADLWEPLRMPVSAR